MTVDGSCIPGALTQAKPDVYYLRVVYVFIGLLFTPLIYIFIFKLELIEANQSILLINVIKLIVRF